MILIKNEKGFIALETLTLFVVFYMVLSLILLLVNISSAQLRIHHALAQTAHEYVFTNLIEDSIRNREPFTHSINIDHVSVVQMYDDEISDAVVRTGREGYVTFTATYYINLLPFRLILRNNDTLLRFPVRKTVQVRGWPDL